MTTPLGAPAAILSLILSLTFLCGGVATADECLSSQVVQEDGRTVISQTKLARKQKLRLVDHALSVTTAVRSGIKMTKPRCKNLPITPSFYLYNGANIVDGVGTVASVTGHKKESRKILKASSEDGSLDKQISVFQRAYEEQLKASQSADKRARILKVTGIARKTAALSAGVEFVLTKIPPPFPQLTFTCSPTPSFNSGQGSESGAQGLLNSALDYAESDVRRTISGAVVKLVAKEKSGEKEPLNRLIYYGTQEIFAKDMARDMKEVSRCMKRRADEYKGMAESLLQRGGGMDGRGNVNTGQVNSPLALHFGQQGDGSDDFNRGDFGGCLVRKNGAFVSDPHCNCARRNSCYQIPNLNSGLAKIAQRDRALRGSQATSLPPGLFSTLGHSKNFINDILSGRTQKAKLASDKMGQGASALDRNLKAVQNKINRLRRKEGKGPIDFNARSRRLAEKMRKTVGDILDRKGIKTIGQFNRAAGIAPPPSRNLSSLGGGGSEGAGESAEEKSQNSPDTLEAVAGGAGEKGGFNNDPEGGIGGSDFFDDEGAGGFPPASFEDHQLGDNDGWPVGPPGQESPDSDKDKADGQKGRFGKGRGIASSLSNIFEKITERYQKSAYPVLLNKKEKRPPAP